ncbi:MAG TPA: hypothetical protein VGM43_14530 [Bryobacteraceae bacterium]|jgi:hypothetical protein
MEQNAGSADIISTLVELNRGKFILTAGQKLGELAEAIIDTGGKGKLTITLEVTPSGMQSGKVNQFEIRPNVSISKPEHAQGKSIFFVTEDGRLTREDPNQMDMEFQETAPNVRS